MAGGQAIGDFANSTGKSKTKKYDPSSFSTLISGGNPVNVIGETSGTTYGSTKDTTGTVAPSDTSGGGSSGSRGSGYTKSNDSALLASLQQMIATGFAAARDTKLANIDRLLEQQNQTLLDGYAVRADGLLGSRLDNEKAEADTSFANWVNRARESADILDQAAAQGAGESDVLKAGLMALRNWDANQSDINRSYFDTARSVNSAIGELNADTKAARVNLYGQANADREAVFTNYYNQMADAYAQVGNLESNKYSNAYNSGSTAYQQAARMAGTAWSNPGVGKDVMDWTGSAQQVEGKLNNTQAGAAVTNLARKAPEGATLRKW